MRGRWRDSWRRAVRAALWRQVLGYGLLLAAGAGLLQWLDLRRMARSSGGDAWLALLALGFLLLGLFLGQRLFAPAPAPAGGEPAGNPQAQASLGLSEREMQVLREIAAGHANKEIAERLHVSLNTVKTHVARILDKLDARRRTEAVQKARELGLLE